MNIASFFQHFRHTFIPPRLGLKRYIPHFRAKWNFWKEYEKYSAMSPYDGKPSQEYFYPCLEDATSTTPVDPSYYFQDAWAFERIFQQHPITHVDVGSHHKFVSLLSKVVPTTMVDIRPLSVTLASLAFKEGTIVDLPFADGSVPSVSSLCVVEHIGLGRYGDPLDPNGTIKAIAELKRIVQPGGDLYISVPVDDVNRTYFNAHRAFCEPYLFELLAPFEIVDRKYIFGSSFTDQLQPGFGTGCYHLVRPLH